jgi:putative oxidoreductase
VTRYEEASYAALRIVAGFMFAFHGVQKILGHFTTKAQPEVFSQMWIGGMIELVGGALIALGLFARPAAFVAAGTMAVAYFQFHWKLQGGAKILPIANGGELSALYCFVFLLIAIKGAGAASLDRMLRRA